jgi:hypothetical protein
LTKRLDPIPERLLKNVTPHDRYPSSRSLPLLGRRYREALKNLESPAVSGLAETAGPEFA